MPESTRAAITSYIASRRIGDPAQPYHYTWIAAKSIRRTRSFQRFGNSFKNEDPDASTRRLILELVTEGSQEPSTICNIGVTKLTQEDLPKGRSRRALIWCTSAPSPSP